MALYNWENAPEWAQWAAKDEDGEAWLYSLPPSTGGTRWVDDDDDLEAEPAGNHRVEFLGPKTLDWRCTLEQRPSQVVLKPGPSTEWRLLIGSTPDPAPPKPPTSVAISKVLREVEAMLLEKNRKYGDSAINPVRIFSKAATDEQLNTRCDDKLSRIMSAQGDDAEDAELDLIGYLILKRVHRFLSSEEAKQLDFNDEL